MAIDLEHANLPYIYTPPPSPPHALRGNPTFRPPPRLRVPPAEIRDHVGYNEPRRRFSRWRSPGRKSRSPRRRGQSQDRRPKRLGRPSRNDNGKPSRRSPRNGPSNPAREG